MAAAIEYQILSKDQTQKGVKSALGNLGKAEKGAEKFQKSMARIFKFSAIIAVGKQVAEFGGKLLNLASTAEETQASLMWFSAGLKKTPMTGSKT